MNDALDVHGVNELTRFRTSWIERMDRLLQTDQENERIVLLQQHTEAIHAIPRRAFPDKAMLVGLRRLARSGVKKSSRQS